jgi:hypothetical protein
MYSALHGESHLRIKIFNDSEGIVVSITGFLAYSRLIYALLYTDREFKLISVQLKI